MLVVSSLRQLPAPVCTIHEAVRSKAHQVAVTNVLASFDGKPARDTHGGLN